MSHVFFRDVWPHVEAAVWPGAVLASTEHCRCPVCRMADRGAAIDGLIEQPDGTVQAFAARIQPDDGWRTFTIRDRLASGRATESAKLRRSNGTGPYWHIHAYMPSDKGPGAIGIVQTSALVHAIDAGVCERKPNGSDDNRFLVVQWRALGALLTEVGFRSRAVAS